MQSIVTIHNKLSLPAVISQGIYFFLMVILLPHRYIFLLLRIVFYQIIFNLTTYEMNLYFKTFT